MKVQERHECFLAHPLLPSCLFLQATTNVSPTQILALIISIQTQSTPITSLCLSTLCPTIDIYNPIQCWHGVGWHCAATGGWDTKSLCLISSSGPEFAWIRPWPKLLQLMATRTGETQVAQTGPSYRRHQLNRKRPIQVFKLHVYSTRKVQCLFHHGGPGFNVQQ